MISTLNIAPPSNNLIFYEPSSCFSTFGCCLDSCIVCCGVMSVAVVFKIDSELDCDPGDENRVAVSQSPMSE